MRKVCSIFVISILLLFIFYKDSPATAMRDYCAIPPFVTLNPPKTNVLIIFDNSNSMDEDFYGNAVGSYSPASKSVVGKKALRDIVERFKDEFRMGLITYKVSGVSAYHIHNSPYFVSYEPKSYCPSHSKVCTNNTSQTCETDSDCSGGTCVDPCVEYCQTLNSTYRSICESQCREDNPSFDVDYFDEIITTYAVGSEQRNRYCNLVYPKTQKLVNPTDTGNYIYYKHAYPFYSPSNEGTEFDYSKRYPDETSSSSEAYDPHEGYKWCSGDFCATDYYYRYRVKEGTSDWFNGYSSDKGTAWFGPTDTDVALGYKDFGRRTMSYHVGQTWFSNTSPGDGYLHVAVDDLVDQSGNDTTTFTNLWNKLDPKENDESGYMSCSNSDKNTCSYIINAGLTPTAGTLQTAIDYLNGEDTPIQYWCQKTFIVYVTDGLPSVDENGNSKTADELMPDVLAKLDTLKNYRCSNDPSKLCTTDEDCSGGGKCVPYKVCSNNLSQSCTKDEDCPSGGYCVSSPHNIKTYILGVGLSNEAKPKLDEMAVHGGTDVNGHAYYADNPEELEEALSKIFLDILKRASSGTAVSVLSTSTRGGGCLAQAYFLPSYTSENNEDLSWKGELKGFWIDAFGQIREDTTSDQKLVLNEDKVMKYFFDKDAGVTKVHLYSSDSTGKVEFPCSPDGTKVLAELKTLWDAGERLWKRSSGDRTIYTSTDGSSFLSGGFAIGNASTLKDYLRAYNDTDAQNIIKYIRGEDVDICLDSDAGTCNETGHRSRELTMNGQTHIWKLGDIVYSTPRILSHFPLNLYHIRYQDGTYTEFIKEKIWNPSADNPIKREDYLLVGANDGMLHCFYLGKLKEKRDEDNPGLRELWAYIPMNVLPYLKYLAYPDYCHIYYVDHRVMLIDASINGSANTTKTKDSWRTILIGELRFGGSPNPPSDAPLVNNKRVGLSSIFALDITDPENPDLLWEFTDPDLGFTTSYPAIVRIGDKNQNGNWYVVLGSGPTDYEGDTPPKYRLYLCN